MSVALPQSSAISLAVPHTQNTAPVLEYRCLFTKDLRQKQKRWQDGRLKLHTFNKRVMVYDERSNNVGDTYWREDHDLEGEELELERGAALIQVGEFLGKREQDLTELVDKRAKEKEERRAARTASSPARPQSAATPVGSHLRPKALNAVIGTPTGHYGRAVIPTTTPFEERQLLRGAKNDENDNGRPAKRRKQMRSPPSKSGYAQNLFGPSMTLSRPPSSATSSYVVARPLLHRPNIKSIDLTGEEDNSGNLRPGLRDNGHPPIIKSNRPKMKKNSAPSASSTYAGNLTGVALTLSAPRALPSMNTAAFSSKATKKVAPQPKLSDDEDISVEIDLPNKSSNTMPRKTKPTNSSRPASKPSRTGPFLSSSPPSKGQATPLATNEDKSTLKHTIPQSTLRIKARPRKQMMMLMEFPGSRGSSKKSSDSMPSKRPASKPVVYEPEPSQATARLNSFIQNQDERLQKRLKSRHVEATPEDPMSSLLDCGIDHETIDALLTRRSNSPPSLGIVSSSVASKKAESIEQLVSDCEDSNEVAEVPSSPETTSEATIFPAKNDRAASLHCIDARENSRSGGMVNAKQSEHSKAKRFEARKANAITELFQKTPSVNREVASSNTIKDMVNDKMQSDTEPRELMRLRKDREAAQRLAEEEQLKLLRLRQELEIAQKKAHEEREAQKRHQQAVEKANEEAARQKALEQERQRSEQMVIEQAARQLALEQERRSLELENQRRIEKEREDAARQQKLEEERQKLDEERQKLDNLRLEIARLEKERQKEIAARDKRLEEEQRAEMVRREELARIEREREIAAAQKRIEEEKEADEMRKELAALRREKELAAEQRRLEDIRRAEEERQREEDERSKRQESQRRRDEEQRFDKAQALTENKATEIRGSSTSGDTILPRSFGASKNKFARASNVALPPHLDNAISSSTDRFRRMIQPSSRPTMSTSLEQSAQIISPTERSKDLPSSEHTSRSFNADTPVEIASNSLRSSSGRARSVNGLNNSFEGPSIGNASMTVGVTKAFKLSRPTRGEATSKAIEGMQPPRGAGSSLSMNDTSGDQPVQCFRKPTLSGPWSREAFDLFPWRPPP